MEIRYRWIRYEKYFNMRLNLGQVINFIKPKFDIHVVCGYSAFLGFKVFSFIKYFINFKTSEQNRVLTRKSFETKVYENSILEINFK
jgi:hypothetical protein